MRVRMRVRGQGQWARVTFTCAVRDVLSLTPSPLTLSEPWPSCLTAHAHLNLNLALTSLPSLLRAAFVSDLKQLRPGIQARQITRIARDDRGGMLAGEQNHHGIGRVGSAPLG